MLRTVLPSSSGNKFHYSLIELLQIDNHSYAPPLTFLQYLCPWVKTFQWFPMVHSIRAKFLTLTFQRFTLSAKPTFLIFSQMSQESVTVLWKHAAQVSNSYCTVFYYLDLRSCFHVAHKNPPHASRLSSFTFRNLPWSPQAPTPVAHSTSTTRVTFTTALCARRPGGPSSLSPY